MHTHQINGRDVHGCYLPTKWMQEEFLNEEWPFDDITVFLIREDKESELETLVGIVPFTRWFKRQMEKDAAIWFIGFQPLSEAESKVMAETIVDDFYNTLRG